MKETVSIAGISSDFATTMLFRYCNFPQSFRFGKYLP
jgi:hypothetical protein